MRHEAVVHIPVIKDKNIDKNSIDVLIFVVQRSPALGFRLRWKKNKKDSKEDINKDLYTPIITADGIIKN